MQRSTVRACISVATGSVGVEVRVKVNIARGVKPAASDTHQQVVLRWGFTGMCGSRGKTLWQ